jgi:hypothetical protein
VPQQWKDTAIVYGKNSSDGEMATMSRARSDPGSARVCAALDGVWEEYYNLPCKTKYNGLTRIRFAEPTKDPRPVDVTLGTDLYNVSKKNHVTDRTDAVTVQYNCGRYSWYSMVCGLGIVNSHRWNEDCL